MLQSYVDWTLSDTAARLKEISFSPRARSLTSLEAQVMRDIDQFIAERALHLAIVHLTRRDDLLVERTSVADSGVDLRVTLRRDSQPTNQVFGVKVQGRSEALKTDRLGRIRPTRSEIRRLRELPFPVALLVFTMEGDYGWYSWVDSTRQDGMGESGWAPLHTEALACIVESVNAWYDTPKPNR